MTQFTPEFIREQKKITPQPDTPLPWEYREGDGEYAIGSGGDDVYYENTTYWDTWNGIEPENMRYVVAAANHYPAALDEIDRLRERLSLIYGLTYDRDGLTTAESLGELVDEVCEISQGKYTFEAGAQPLPAPPESEG
jgi:CubicO group peptidase (beta-lactamase class C family)